MTQAGGQHSASVAANASQHVMAAVLVMRLQVTCCLALHAVLGKMVVHHTTE
jgi:hypothetical protein